MSLLGGSRRPFSSAQASRAPEHPVRPLDASGRPRASARAYLLLGPAELLLHLLGKEASSTASLALSHPVGSLGAAGPDREPCGFLEAPEEEVRFPACLASGPGGRASYFPTAVAPARLGRSAPGRLGTTLRPPGGRLGTTPRPPRGRLGTTPRPPRDYPETTPRPPRGHPETTPRPPRGHPETTPRPPQDHPAASGLPRDHPRPHRGHLRNTLRPPRTTPEHPQVASGPPDATPKPSAASLGPYSSHPETHFGVHVEVHSSPASTDPLKPSPWSSLGVRPRGQVGTSGAQDRGWACWEEAGNSGLPSGGALSRPPSKFSSPEVQEHQPQ